MRTFILSAMMAIALQHSATAQTLGKPAPGIFFSTVLNKKNVTAANLEHKYIVLDFWATWCGPCVASLPHFSELSDRFSSDSVVFAIISSEERNKVRTFLSKRQVHALQLIDSITKASRDGAKINELFGLTAQGFGVEGIPHTVVIDNNGILRWVGTSQSLTAQTIEDILSGKSAKVQEQLEKDRATYAKDRELRKQIFATLHKDTIEGFNYKLIVAKVPYMVPEMSAGLDAKTHKNFVEFSGHTLDFLCFYFTRTSFNRIKNMTSDKSAGYFVRFEMDASASINEFRNTAVDALTKVCHVSFSQNEIPAAVWKLKIKDQKKFIENSKPLDAETDHSSSDIGGTEMIFNNFTLSSAIPGMEGQLKVFIEPEKNELNNRLADFKIPKGNGDMTFISTKLMELYGIELTKEQGKTTITEIRETN